MYPASIRSVLAFVYNREVYDRQVLRRQVIDRYVLFQCTRKTGEGWAYLYNSICLSPLVFKNFLIAIFGSVTDNTSLREKPNRTRNLRSSVLSSSHWYLLVHSP